MSQAKKKPVKKFMRGLLAASCLTAASAGAHASTVTESGNNFGQTFGTATVLPAGTSTVIGSVADGTNVDFFEFTSLNSGGAFDLEFTNTASGNFIGNTFNSSDVAIGSNAGTANVTSSPLDITGTVPGDGKIVVEISNGEFASTYQVDVVTGLSSGVPEPGAGLLTGLGAATGMIGLRRRKRNR